MEFLSLVSQDCQLSLLGFTNSQGISMNSAYEAAAYETVQLLFLGALL